jgi:hypothetical protein
MTHYDGWLMVVGMCFLSGYYYHTDEQHRAAGLETFPIFGEDPCDVAENWGCRLMWEDHGCPSTQASSPKLGASAFSGRKEHEP